MDHYMLKAEKKQDKTLRFVIKSHHYINPEHFITVTIGGSRPHMHGFCPLVERNFPLSRWPILLFRSEEKLSLFDT